MTDTTPAEGTEAEPYRCGQWETNCNNRAWPPIHTQACADRNARPTPPVPAAEGDAVERAARIAARTYHGSDAYWGPLGPLWTAVARAALDAAGVPALRAERDAVRATVSRMDWANISALREVGAWDEDAPGVVTSIHALAAQRDQARRQVADLRAGIDGLERWAVPAGYVGHASDDYLRRIGAPTAVPVVKADDLRALLAGSGEQPGEEPRCPECGGSGVVQEAHDGGTHPVHCPCTYRPAPAVPDSAGLRSVAAARVAFEEAGVRLMATVGSDATRYLDALTRAVMAGATVADLDRLAVVGQGVTAEQAWREGEKAGEEFERSRWQWSAGATARAVNGLTERPERPANPYRPAPSTTTEGNDHA